MPPEIAAALISEAGKTIRWIIGGGTAILGAYFAGLLPEGAASDDAFRIISGSVIMGVAGLAFGFGGVVYGRLEREHRLTKTRELSERIQELEEMIHPERTSSGLSPDGQTHPRDV